MKVTCRRATSPSGAALPSDEYGWLRIGAEYVVLTLEIESPFSIWVRLLTELHQVAMFRIDDFEVSDPSVSALWVLDFVEGYLTLAIPSWNEAGFWERVYDNEPATVAQLEADVAALHAEAAND